MLTVRELHARLHEATGVTFASLYPGCIAETGLFREHFGLFRTLFPPFQKYITKGYVSEDEAGRRLAQARMPPFFAFCLCCLIMPGTSGSQALLVSTLDRKKSDCTILARSTVFLRCMLGGGLDKEGQGCDPCKLSAVAQVISDPALSKSGTYWSWNNDSESFENQVSEEVSDAEKGRKLWELSERLVGLKA